MNGKRWRKSLKWKQQTNAATAAFVDSFSFCSMFMRYVLSIQRTVVVWVRTAYAACPLKFISTDKTMDEYDFDELIWIYYIFSFCLRSDRPPRPPAHPLVHCFFQRSWINNNLRKINVENNGKYLSLWFSNAFHWPRGADSWLRRYMVMPQLY